MLRIGLTGGIAAGKSVAARRFAELGAVVIDHDLLAREAVAPGTIGLERVVDEFGDDILDAEGALDRAALGHIVFGNQKARARLDALLHPEIHRLSVEREAAAGAADPGAVVVHDIPLLVETGQADAFHILVLVDAPADLRIRRLVENRGLSLPDARKRVGAQATDEARRAAADVVLSGATSDDALRGAVDAFWNRVQDEVAQEIV